MIGNKKPYNAGELRRHGSHTYIICGHIWWPVEKENAYYVLKAGPDGLPTTDIPEYIWQHEEWPLVQAS